MEKINEYFESPNISQSFLKLFLKGQARSLNREKETHYFYEEKKHFIHGSLIDFLCTMPNTDIDDLYCIDSLLDKPSVSIMSIIHELKHEELEWNDENLVTIARKQEYQKNWKDETIVNKIINHKDYYDYLVECGDKQIISKDEWDLAVECSNSLLNSPYTSPYFSDKIEYQRAFYKGNLKGLVDMFYIDHKKKEFRVIDIKSTQSYLENFDVFKFRYDFQLSFYNHLAKMEYPKYKDLPPVILAVSKKESGYAEPFEFTKNTLKLGSDGGIIDGKEVLGWKACLNNYIYWEQNQNVYSKSLIENKVNYV